MKKWENPILRVKYANENPQCELHKHFPGRFRGKNSHHTHHIFGGKQRWDLRSNLIRLSAYAHSAVHENPIEGRLWCLYAKMMKGEFDLHEFRLASGMNLFGWLTQKKVMDKVAETMNERQLEIWRDVTDFAEVLSESQHGIEF